MAAAKLRPTFEVDKKGMSKVFARKTKASLIIELVQNAWDEDTTEVDITLEWKDGKAKIVVQDDNPEGFADLAHAYTLFAESKKKDDVTKRGRFNLGEKLVIAMCKEASIATTKGTIVFTEKGRVHTTKKRKAGSVFTGIIVMTKAEAEETEKAIHSLIPPHGITTVFNMTPVAERKPVKEFTASLRTERSDDEGNLKPTTRKCKVEVYEPLDGEQPGIYEMGIPVVATEDRFHVNVGQKVPLGLDRDSVPPAYMRTLRVEVLNNTHDLLSPEDTKAAWVANALEDERVDPAAAQAAFTGKFGSKAVTFDPNDHEANKRAAAAGYTVVPGGALPKAAWKNVKGHGVVQPAGQVTPSPSVQAADAEGMKAMDPDHYPEYVENVVEFSKELGRELLGIELVVRVVNEAGAGFNACFAYGGNELTFNLGALGHKWFDRSNGQDIIDLLFDEFAHHYAGDHLDTAYYRALRTLGAKAVVAALTKPGLFDRLDIQEGVMA